MNRGGWITDLGGLDAGGVGFGELVVGRHSPMGSFFLFRGKVGRRLLLLFFGIGKAVVVKWKIGWIGMMMMMTMELEKTGEEEKWGLSYIYEMYV